MALQADEAISQGTFRLRPQPMPLVGLARASIGVAYQQMHATGIPAPHQREQGTVIFLVSRQPAVGQPPSSPSIMIKASRISLPYQQKLLSR
jgi:hypothetical protein